MLSAGFLTIDTLKERLLPGAIAQSGEWDANLQALGRGVAMAMNRHCNRNLERLAGAVYEVGAATRLIVLSRYPVETITSVYVRDYTGSLDEHTAGYQLDEGAGLMTFVDYPGTSTDRIVVTFTGGYWLDDGDAMPEGATAMPDDLTEAFVMQCQAWAEARGTFSSISLTTADEKKAKPSGAELLPQVVRILASYRRFASE